MKLATITMSLLAAPTYLLDILLDLTTVALLEILLGPPMSLLRCRAPSAPEPPRARRTSSPAAIRGTRRGRLGQTITPTARFLQETEPGGCSWLIWKPKVRVAREIEHRDWASTETARWNLVEAEWVSRGRQEAEICCRTVTGSATRTVLHPLH